MDTAQWPQEIVVKPIEEIVTNNTCSKAGGNLERKARPQKEQALTCPRCNSTNTKFCYYNNYSLTQPRYFCKTCRRYWTEGGSLRNIPVGGGSRKNKRSSSSSAPSSSSSAAAAALSSSSSKKLPDLVTPPSLSTQSSTHHHHHQNPKIIHDGQDLNLAFPSTQGIRSFSELMQLPSIENNNSTTKNQIPSSSAAASSTPTTSQLSALELLTGFSSRGLNSFMPIPLQDPNTVYTTGFPLHQDFKPTSLNFSLDGLGSGYGSSLHGAQENNGRLLFPFEDLKQVPSTNDDIEPNKEQGDSTGYWTGMLGGGSW